MNLNKKIKATQKSENYKRKIAVKVWENLTGDISGLRNYWIKNQEQVINLFVEILPLVSSIPRKESLDQLVRNLSNLRDLSGLERGHKNFLKDLINDTNIELTAKSIFRGLGLGR